MGLGFVGGLFPSLPSGFSSERKGEDVNALERREQVAELTKAGETAAIIAYRLGISPRHVQRLRAQCGVTRQRFPVMTEAQKRWAEGLLDDGASYAEAARTVGCTPVAVRRAFPGRGWTRPMIYEYLSALRNARGIL